MLSLEEHQDLGADLHKAYEIMIKSDTLLKRNYPKNSDQVKMAVQAQELIRSLRYLMDDIVFSELPNEDKKTVNRLYCHPK